MLMLAASKTTYFERVEDVPAWQVASPLYRKCMQWYYWLTGIIALPVYFSFTTSAEAVSEMREGDRLLLHDEHGKTREAAIAHIHNDTLYCFYFDSALPASYMAWSYWEAVRDGRPTC